MTEEHKAAIAEAARSFVGVPFFHAGRSMRGMDCIGVAVMAARAAGLHPYDNPNYSPIVDGDFMQAELTKSCDVVEGEPEIGDLLLFMIGNNPQHIGVVIGISGWVEMVHAYQTIGMVTRTRVDASWMRRLIGIYRWREV